MSRKWTLNLTQPQKVIYEVRIVQDHIQIQLISLNNVPHLSKKGPIEKIMQYSIWKNQEFCKELITLWKTWKKLGRARAKWVCLKRQTGPSTC